MQLFLNTWLKNQLFVTFRYFRSAYIGYRDTLQDSWGYSLIEPEKARAQILRTLAHMLRDGPARATTRPTTTAPTSAASWIPAPGLP
jgi:cellobiose phosphorylase